MKNRFLGVICILYSIIIGFVWRYNILGNFLAPQMQIYLKVSIVPLLIMGVFICFSEKTYYTFKVIDLVLILPLIMLIFAGDGRLTASFASNRTMSNEKITKKVKTKEKVKKEKKKTTKEEEKNEELNVDLNSIDFDVIDESYNSLANTITFTEDDTYINKTIRVRGFVNNDVEFAPDGYFAIGKYSVNCCAADSLFVGFIAEKGDYKIKNNSWYEVVGVLKHAVDKAGYDITVIKPVSVNEIDQNSEEQYVYPCYSYGDGTCAEVKKYGLEN